jgi:hypothetical protein
VFFVALHGSGEEVGRARIILCCRRAHSLPARAALLLLLMYFQSSCYTTDARRPVSRLMADPTKKTTNKIQAI